MAPEDSNKTGKTAQPLDKKALENLLGFQLRSAQIKLFQHFKSSLADLSITPGKAGVLILIENNPGISQSALARALEIERATLGETITGLEQKHWVERRKSPSDGRSHALYLSENGEKLMKTLHTTINSHEKKVSANLSKNEYREFIHLLIKFNMS